MKKYLILGFVRNLFGVGLLTFLDYLNVEISIALFMVIFIGFNLYVLQVKNTIGLVSLKAVVKTYIFVYIANRLLLLLFYDHLGWPVYAAQIVSIVFLSGGSYLYLKKEKRNSRDSLKEAV